MRGATCFFFFFVLFASLVGEFIKCHGNKTQARQIILLHCLCSVGFFFLDAHACYIVVEVERTIRCGWWSLFTDQAVIGIHLVKGYHSSGCRFFFALTPAVLSLCYRDAVNCTFALALFFHSFYESRVIRLWSGIEHALVNSNTCTICPSTSSFWEFRVFSLLFLSILALSPLLFFLLFFFLAFNPFSLSSLFSPTLSFFFSISISRVKAHAVTCKW